MIADILHLSITFALLDVRRCISAFVPRRVQPDGISHLVNLEELRLDSNSLSQLPPVSLLTYLLIRFEQIVVNFKNRN